MLIDHNKSIKKLLLDRAQAACKRKYFCAHIDVTGYNCWSAVVTVKFMVKEHVGSKTWKLIELWTPLPHCCSL